MIYKSLSSRVLKYYSQVKTIGFSFHRKHIVAYQACWSGTNSSRFYKRDFVQYTRRNDDTISRHELPLYSYDNMRHRCCACAQPMYSGAQSNVVNKLSGVLWNARVQCLVATKIVLITIALLQSLINQVLHSLVLRHTWRNDYCCTLFQFRYVGLGMRLGHVTFKLKWGNTTAAGLSTMCSTVSWIYLYKESLSKQPSLGTRSVLASPDYSQPSSVCWWAVFWLWDRDIVTIMSR